MDNNKLSNQTKGSLVLLVAIFFVSSESVVAKLCYLNGMNVYSLLAMRFVLASLCFAGYLLWQKKKLLLNNKYLLATFGVTVFHVAATMLVYWGFKLMPAGMAVLLFNIYSIFTAVLDTVINKKPFTKIKIIALVLAAVGLTIFCSSSLGTVSTAGVIVVIIGAFSYALYTILVAKLLVHVDTDTYTGNHIFASTVYYFVIMLIVGQITMPAQASTVGFIVLLAVFPTFIAFLLFSRGLSLAGPFLAALSYILEVPLASIFAYFIFGDTWHLWQLVGAVLIITAVVLPNVWAIKAERQAVQNLQKQEG